MDDKPSLDELTVLEHHGVKGMRWGVRRDLATIKATGRRSNEMGLVSRKMQAKADAKKAASSSTPKMSRKEKRAAKPSRFTDTRGSKISKGDVKWINKGTTTAKAMQVHNAAADRMNNVHISRINNKPEYKNADFTHDSPLRQQYYKEYSDTFTNEMNKASDRIIGPSPSGKYRVKFTDVGDMFPAWEVDYTDVQHVDGPPSLDVTYDSSGHIRKFNFSDPISHGEIAVKNILAHSGNSVLSTT